MATIPHTPIIVTALMGAADFGWADGLRRAHFPPKRNHIPAHISLFHHLPPARLGELTRMMRDLAAGPPPPARLSEVMMLGRGVAFRVESPDLLAMREQIAEAFQYDLIPQDQGTPRLHITVQNKVEPAVAKALHGTLSADFRPRPLTIAGLAAWHYLGGPWQLAAQIRFRGRHR
jgi:2'-5' RNA ligase superfamily